MSSPIHSKPPPGWKPGALYVYEARPPAEPSETPELEYMSTCFEKPNTHEARYNKNSLRRLELSKQEFKDLIRALCKEPRNADQFAQREGTDMSRGPKGRAGD
jgi:hypothetical protein